jgi:hypothetical protein
MRGTFAIVLVAGVGAAVGLSMALGRGAGEATNAPTVRSSDPPPVEATPSSKPAIEAVERAPAAASSVAARVDDLLQKSDLSGAARVVLSADPKELRDAAVRERGFKAADALVASTGAVADKPATAARLDARKIYSALYACDASTTEEMTRAFDACTRLDQSLLFGNGSPDELVLRHKIAPGESVWALAKGAWKQKGVSVSPGFVLHVNGISDARRVRSGQTLRVPLEPMKILVRKSRFELAVLLGGAPIERFPVAVGAEASTPAGVFKIRDRIQNPDWYFHGRRIPFGDPQNIIGTRWLGLTGAAAADGIGIHGTADDGSIGKAVSMGCVRMHNADVEKLFEWVDAGVEVEIRD